MNLLKSRYLLAAGLTAIALTLSACDDAKSGGNGGGGTPAVETDTDNCPLIANPIPSGATKQLDSDNNGIGDACQCGKDFKGSGHRNHRHGHGVLRKSARTVPAC